MNNTLYLTADETKVFRSLSQNIQNGWQIESERVVEPESADKRQARLQIARVRDPKLVALNEKAATATSVDALVKLIEDTDLKDVNNADLAQLFFALGPDTLSSIIGHLLSKTSSDDDVLSIEALAHIRHALLSSIVS